MTIVSLLLNLFIGVCAGLGAATYLFWRRWFNRRLRDVESDIDQMYRMHGIVPPGAERARVALGMPPFHLPPDDHPDTP